MDDLQLNYRFTTLAAPVQAEGLVAGRRFYFRARHTRWTFAVAEREDIDPVLIDTPEQGRQFGFFAEGRYGDGPHSASWMPQEEAEAIIQKCAAQYTGRRAD